MDSSSTKISKRMSCKYVNKSQKFIFSGQDYSRQYFHLYSYRLNQMTKLLKDVVHRKWGTKFPIKKLCDLREEREEICVIIGTIFKHQELKPSILREISEEMQLDPQPPRENYISDNDKLILEDELQRIRLFGKIDVNYIVTGVVCAVLGYVESDGKLTVDDYVFYESGPQRPLSKLETSPLVILISGLDMSTTDDITMSLELFKQWLQGNAEEFNNNPKLNPSNVARIIIAGNSIRASPQKKEKILQIRKPESPNVLNAVILLDKLIASWCQIVPVDLMPGEFDPSNFLLPQQPFHPCMFTESVKLTKNNKNSFKSVTNPYGCEVDGRFILGSSGQNVNDIMRTSKIDDPIEALRSTIIWSHLSPTSPDTLPCYPYTNTDPFILDECPHIYYAGNQLEFKTDLYKGQNKTCRLVSVPSFIRTKSVAVVNLSTLECHQLNFKVKESKE